MQILHARNRGRKHGSRNPHPSIGPVVTLWQASSTPRKSPTKAANCTEYSIKLCSQIIQIIQETHIAGVVSEHTIASHSWPQQAFEMYIWASHGTAIIKHRISAYLCLKVSWGETSLLESLVPGNMTIPRGWLGSSTPYEANHAAGQATTKKHDRRHGHHEDRRRGPRARRRGGRLASKDHVPYYRTCGKRQVSAKHAPSM